MEQVKRVKITRLRKNDSLYEKERKGGDVTVRSGNRVSLTILLAESLSRANTCPKPDCTQQCGDAVVTGGHEVSHSGGDHSSYYE